MNENDNNSNKLVTLEEAADFLQLKKSTIYGMTHRKEIPFLKYGSRLRFRLADLSEWRDSRLIRIPTNEDLRIQAGKYCINLK